MTPPKVMGCCGNGRGNHGRVRGFGVIQTSQVPGHVGHRN